MLRSRKRANIGKFLLTLSLRGYLKTRICWGRGQYDPPPSKSHVWCPNMKNDTSLESSCALLLESAKKFAKIIFFIAKSCYIVKMFAKKICSKNEKLYIFEKPLTMQFKICKNFCQILNNLIFNQEKLKMSKFPWQVVYKTCAIRLFHVKGFPKS